MNNKTFICLGFCLALIIFGCSKDSPVSNEMRRSEQASDLSNAKRATWITGISRLAETVDCDYKGEGATYALKLTGDFEGCHYVWIEEYRCSGDGIYFEKGRELFVGMYKGQPGSFRTTYKFRGKYEGCKEDGGPLGSEIIGGCQHPIVKGSGKGVFEGAFGALHFWDDVEVGKFPYVGQLRF